MEFQIIHIKSQRFIHAWWQTLFNPILLVEWRESYLNSELLSMHLQECGGKEKGRNTHARLTSPGEARQRAWADNMVMNSTSKFVLERPSQLSDVVTLSGSP
jgi:hypothetical protein